MPDPAFSQQGIGNPIRDRGILLEVYTRALLLVAPQRLAGLQSAKPLPASLWSDSPSDQERSERGTLVLISLALLEELKSAETPVDARGELIRSVRSPRLDRFPRGPEDLSVVPLPPEENAIVSRYLLGLAPEVRRVLEACDKPDAPKLRLHHTADLGDVSPNGLAEVFWHVLALKNWTTAAHSIRVADLCVAMAEHRSLPQSDLCTLKVAGLLHDVGKLGVDSILLEKEGDLEPPERSEMRAHARIGEDLLSGFPRLRNIASIVGRHHEKCDGSGYPLGLKGESIDPLSRILTVADVYDALAYERPYRAALSPADVFSIMIDEMGAALDQDIVADLRAVLADESVYGEVPKA